MDRLGYADVLFRELWLSRTNRPDCGARLSLWPRPSMSLGVEGVEGVEGVSYSLLILNHIY